MTAERAARARFMTTLHDADATGRAARSKRAADDRLREWGGVHAAARDVQTVSTKKNPAARGAAGS
ncbi:hypothetical protein C7G43_00505 [Bradyrhizobium sp. MOS004]|nr:hypothetical protein C7G43_00505 [Bradyrhizobium sp. MOS004]HAQ82521.1 hypothetical protein [Bradyrhizobium sp.]HAR13969.1 hypothetical protein [Bradyrhizobium sp.]HAR26036.1 hypothetical protein [Bradyrhizobium sp.]HBY31298.1 hypothetical protein [Bradyrhizobium sp.]